MERNNFEAANEAVIAETEAVRADASHDSLLARAAHLAGDLGKIAVSGQGTALLAEALRRPL
jgi:hypothetical protein